MFAVAPKIRNKNNVRFSFDSSTDFVATALCAVSCLDRARHGTSPSVGGRGGYSPNTRKLSAKFCRGSSLLPKTERSQRPLQWPVRTAAEEPAANIRCQKKEKCSLSIRM